MGNKTVYWPLWLDMDYYDAYGSLYSPSPHFLIGSMTRIGSDDPLYRSRIKSGSGATNPMTVTVAKVEKLHVGGLSVRMVNAYGNPANNILVNCRKLAQVYAISTDEPSAELVSSVSNKALIGVIKKVRSHMQSDFSGPTFVGEFRSLVHSIRHPFETLRKHLNIFVNLERRIKNDKLKRRGKRDTNWANAISSSWLEFAFSVQPSINDITEICKILSSKFNRRPGISRVSYRYTDREVSQFDEIVAPPGIEAGCILTSRVDKKASCQYVLGVKRDFPSMQRAQTPIQQLIDYGRFDLAEIVPTAWELIPFSWLIDYVTNVGDVLGCNFDYNQYVIWGSQTVIRDSTRLRFGRVVWPTPYGRIEGFDPEEFITRYKTVNRTVANTLGFPEFEFSLPNIQQANNALQLVISLASSPQLSRQNMRYAW